MDKVFNFILDNKYIGIGALIVFVIVIILILYSKNQANSKRKNISNNNSKKVYTLNDCKSYEDINFKIDEYQNNLKNELLRNKKIIENAKNKGYIKANTVWTKRFQEFTQISNTLYKNLEYENSRKLNANKFHRYTSLHFRSMILGKLAYKDYIDSKKVRNEINELLVAIGKKQVRVTASEKRELYDVKDTCVKTTQYLYDRMIAIEQKTGHLRDKIRDECGKRGKEWYDRLQKNKQ